MGAKNRICATFTEEPQVTWGWERRHQKIAVEEKARGAEFKCQPQIVETGWSTPGKQGERQWPF
jgi:hypothetical protein